MVRFYPLNQAVSFYARAKYSQRLHFCTLGAVFIKSKNIFSYTDFTEKGSKVQKCKIIPPQGGDGALVQK